MVPTRTLRGVVAAAAAITGTVATVVAVRSHRADRASAVPVTSTPVPGTPPAAVTPDEDLSFREWVSSKVGSESPFGQRARGQMFYRVGLIGTVALGIVFGGGAFAFGIVALAGAVR